MSEEFRLPDELMAIQSRLSGLTPAPSGIDQDQLMYRTGWAAAETQGRKWRWVTPLACAATALFAVMLTRTSDRPAVAVKEEPAAEVVVESEPMVPAPHVAPAVPSLATARFSTARAPMLALRERALRFDFDERATPVLAASVKSRNPTPSMQQLRDEFLPRPEMPNWLPGQWEWPQQWNIYQEKT